MFAHSNNNLRIVAVRQMYTQNNIYLFISTSRLCGMLCSVLRHSIYTHAHDENAIGFWPASWFSGNAWCATPIPIHMYGGDVVCLWHTCVSFFLTRNRFVCMAVGCKLQWYSVQFQLLLMLFPFFFSCVSYYCTHHTVGSHQRAWEYFIESIQRPSAFLATHCEPKSLVPTKNHTEIDCDKNISAYMGYNADTR